ncbi:hypothetical protein FRC17_009440 [Serendipita sp. 399]|nr:hypothetical protein FRC17_009440 [Serendipita sp. 399]
MVVSLIEFGVSMGDGYFGGYSVWMAPAGAILTEILHSVTLPVWKKTARKRKGTTKPSFIYSITLCVLTCLLALYWFAISVFTLVLAGSIAEYSYDENPGMAFAEGTFGLILSGLTWAEFGIIVHYRKLFLKKIKRARQNSQGQEGYGGGYQGQGQTTNNTYIPPVDPKYNTNTNNTQQQMYGQYGAAPPYPSPGPQPPHPVNVVNPVVNPPYPVYNQNPINQQGYNPQQFTPQPYSVVNYQPQPPMAQMNLMQKDAGK